MAQTAFGAEDAVSDAVENVQDAVNEDIAKGFDADRFGPSARKLGWRGSLSAAATFNSGNTENSSVAIGSKFGYGGQVWDHDVALSYGVAESAGTRTGNDFAIAYDASRYFNDRFYGYGNISYSYDEFGAYEQDGFVGVGIGYRVVDQGNFAWRLQGGPGYRVTKTSTGIENEEIAGKLGSRIFYEVSDTAFLTNDTTLLVSDSDTSVINDLGLNVAIAGPMTLRTSLKTEYHSDPAEGRDEVDNSLGLSLVYTFN
jgi:putative salt-induced outer membrane protein